MKKAIFFTMLSAALLLTAYSPSISRNPPGTQQEKQPAPVKKSTMGGGRTGGGGTGGSQQDTLSKKATPVHKGKHLDSLHHIRKIKH